MKLETFLIKAAVIIIMVVTKEANMGPQKGTRTRNITMLRIRGFGLGCVA